MSSPERRPLRRLERRCDWLLARIAIGESQGRDVNRDVAELSALRWLIDTSATQHVDLVTENQRLKTKIPNQRQEIRMLLARQEGRALSGNDLEAPVDVVVTSPSAAVPAEEASGEAGEGKCRR
jgi:hypothetical protein